jgi:hypothetical protein
MKHTITIQETKDGPVIDLPYLSKDQLGILIQSASMALRDHAAREQELAMGQSVAGAVGQQDFHVFESGAKRSEKIEARYDLIPEGPERRRALRYGMGEQRHGEYNWQKGLPFEDTFNHIIEHLYKARAKYRAGVPMSLEDDDLAGASLGIDFLMFFDDRGDYRGRDEVKAKVGRIAREALEKMRTQDQQRLAPDTRD